MLHLQQFVSPSRSCYLHVQADIYGVAGECWEEELYLALGLAGKVMQIHC